jgi:hypothetical protein
VGGSTLNGLLSLSRRCNQNTFRKRHDLLSQVRDIPVAASRFREVRRQPSPTLGCGRFAARSHFFKFGFGSFNGAVLHALPRPDTPCRSDPAGRSSFIPNRAGNCYRSAIHLDPVQRERPETTMTTTRFCHDYEIVQSAYDPNRSWELVVAASHGREVARIRFRTYGDAWREAERLKAAESEPENPAAERPISKRLNVSAPEHDIPQFPGSA